MANLGPTHLAVHTFTTDAERWKTLKTYARANRRNPTPAENHLWQALRGHHLGPQCRRQHAIECFIVDFVCLRAWLVVEVDGRVHLGQEEYDGGRTHSLQECGFLALRFSNEQVLNDLDGVLAEVRRHLALLLPSDLPHPPAPSPSGEGEPDVS